MASKYLQKFPVPSGFADILHDYSREILRDQPDDILDYSFHYFDSLCNGQSYKYNGPSNIPREDQKYKLEFDTKVEISEIKKNLVPLDKEMKNKRPISAAKSDQRSIRSGKSGKSFKTNTTHPEEKHAARDYMDELILENQDENFNEEIIGLSEQQMRTESKENEIEEEEENIGEDPMDLVTGQSIRNMHSDENKEENDDSNVQGFLNRNTIPESSAKNDSFDLANSDFPIKGELDIYIDQLSNMPLKYAYHVECKVINVSKRSGISETGKNPNVRQMLTIPIGINEDQVNDLIMIVTVIDNVRLQEIAIARVPITLAIKSKGVWAMTPTIVLEGRNIFNSAALLNIRFRAFGESFEEAEPPCKCQDEMTLTLAKNVFLKPEVYGRFLVKVVKARRLRPMDGLYEKSDPYVEYWLSHNPEEKTYTGAIFQELDPVWNDCKVLNVSLTREEFFNLVLYFRVWDKDLIGEDFLGECLVDLRKLTNNMGNWVNRYFKLKDQKVSPDTDCGDIYIQVTWLPGDEKFIGSFPEVIETEKVLEHSGTIEGDLAFYIIKARNLRPMDEPGEKSDPYCEYYFSHETEERYYTSAIFQDLSPIWNEKMTYTFRLLPEEIENWKAVINVWDKDVVGEDFEGGVEIDLTAAVKNPGEWIKEYFPLKDETALEGEDIGEIYIQFAWFESNKDYGSSEG